MGRTIKSSAKTIAERVLRVRILPAGQLPRGFDLFADLRLDLSSFTPRVVFDVGAWVGDSAVAFLDAFPETEVYCFEPAAKTFSQLSERFDSHHRVHCLPLAMGAEPGEATLMTDESDSCISSLSPTAVVAGLPGAKTERVEVESLDRFTRSKGIEHIGFLHVDTEGHDLEVLRGADRLLGSGGVDLIEVEAGMNPQNGTHVPIELLKRHLEERGYSLFALYEQVPEVYLRKPHLRRVNAVFVSAQVIAAQEVIGV